jgi:hypothetical protein
MHGTKATIILLEVFEIYPKYYSVDLMGHRVSVGGQLMLTGKLEAIRKT